jgi:ubiquinone/menaquinone biosynthesis C-methylase UbiE
MAEHVCPFWLIRTFDNALRRGVHPPGELLSGLAAPGDHGADLGCGIGYFTIPLARIVGPTGSVTAVDLQAPMLEGVGRRARKAGLEERVRLLRSEGPLPAFDRHLDFALCFWMLHEVPGPEAFLRGIHDALRPGGRLLVVEPRIHVGRRAFDAAADRVVEAGFVLAAEPRVALSRALLFLRPD